MKNKTLLGILAFIVAFAAIAALCIPTPAAAQVAADTVAATAPVSSTVGGDIINAISGKIPGWLVTALSIFGTVSLAAQGFIGWAHKRAAETATPDDDAWIAKAEASVWFRVIDRIIYFGGYLGSALGGKKL